MMDETTTCTMRTDPTMLNRAGTMAHAPMRLFPANPNTIGIAPVAYARRRDLALRLLARGEDA